MAATRSTGQWKGLIRQQQFLPLILVFFLTQVMNWKAYSCFRRIGGGEGSQRSHGLRFFEWGAQSSGAGSASGPALRAAGSSGSHTDGSSTYLYSEMGVSR